MRIFFFKGLFFFQFPISFAKNCDINVFFMGFRTRKKSAQKNCFQSFFFSVVCFKMFWFVDVVYRNCFTMKFMCVHAFLRNQFSSGPNNLYNFTLIFIFY